MTKQSSFSAFLLEKHLESADRHKDIHSTHKLLQWGSWKKPKRFPRREVPLSIPAQTPEEYYAAGVKRME